MGLFTGHLGDLHRGRRAPAVADADPAAPRRHCNAYAERFVRSIKEECLERMIFFGQASPQRAVQELQGSYRVAVVGADNKVGFRPVKAGARIGNLWVIDEGLNPGERIVAEGLQKVRDGLVVNPKTVPTAPESQQATVPATTPAPAAVASTATKTKE